MTEEYNFFKDFAGVTKADLETLKCGGRMKKKAESGAALTVAKIGAEALKKLRQKRRDAQLLDSILKAQKEQTQLQQKHLEDIRNKRGIHTYDDYKKYDEEKKKHWQNKPKKNNPIYE